MTVGVILGATSVCVDIGSEATGIRRNIEYGKDYATLEIMLFSLNFDLSFLFYFLGRLGTGTHLLWGFQPVNLANSQFHTC